MINTKQNSSYQGKIYGIYIALRFIVEMWDGSNNQKGKIGIRCDNLLGVLDSAKNKKIKNASSNATSDKEKDCIIIKKWPLNQPITY